MSNRSTWLTIGLAGLGAAAAAASRGSANTLGPLEIDYSQALITGELWTGDWMLEQDSSLWYDLSPEDEDDHGEPLLRAPWPDKAHPYHLLAYDVRGQRARKGASMERLAEHLDHVFKEDLLPKLGLKEGRMWNRGFVRSHWADAAEGELKLNVVIGVCTQPELVRILKRIHELDDDTSSRVTIDLGMFGEVTFHDLSLYPKGVNGPSYPLINVHTRRGLGGRTRILLQAD